MPRRRPRRLSAEDQETWKAVARSVRRLRQSSAPDTAEAGPATAFTADIQPQSAQRQAVQPPAAPLPPPRSVVPQGPARPRVTVDLAGDPFTAADAPRIDRRRLERLMRGKLAPEARLDLHGMTRESAHAALVGFVLSAQAKGLRLVLVITGKGRPDRSDSVVPERQGILRHSLPHWLAAPPLTGRVVECRPAHPRHGGAGAVYLYLRRRS